MKCFLFFQIHYGWAASDRKSLRQGLTWMFRGKLQPRESPIFSGRRWYPSRWCSLCCKGWPGQEPMWGYPHRWQLQSHVLQVGSRASLSAMDRTVPCAPHVWLETSAPPGTPECTFIDKAALTPSEWEQCPGTQQRAMYLDVDLKFLHF